MVSNELTRKALKTLRLKLQLTFNNKIGLGAGVLRIFISNTLKTRCSGLKLGACVYLIASKFTFKNIFFKPGCKCLQLHG